MKNSCRNTRVDQILKRSVQLAYFKMIRSALTLCFVLGGVQGALADEPAQSSDSAVIQEVVVTAQKRSENLQSVPISVNVFTAQEMSLQNLDSLTDVARIDPSMTVVGTSGRAGGLYIRGIGSGGSTAFDQSVGVFIDDIYHGRVHTSSAEFLDIDRVEVLKGPQSTYFGNNAIAGAFNVVTKQPTNDFDASFRGLYGQYGEYEAEGAVNVPVNDKFQVRMAAMANGENGWVTNVAPGADNQKYPHENNFAGRITLRFAPTENLDATLKAEGASNRNTGGLYLQVVGCPPPAPFTAAGFCKSGIDSAVPQGLTNILSEAPGQQIDLSSNEDVLTVHYHQWDHTFTSVTGFYSYHYLLNLNAAGTTLNEVNAQQPQKYQQFSQEFRVASPTNQLVEYMAGLYFQTDQLFDDVDQSYFFLTPTITARKPFASLVPYLPLGQDVYYHQLEHIYSAFTSATWNVTDALKLGVGLREMVVNKDYNWKLTYGTATQAYGAVVPLPAPIATLPNALGLGTAGSLSGTGQYRGLTPSFRAQYQLDPAAMLYFTYARGFKAGGFNGDDNSAVASNLPYGPEHVNAYELGMKSEWFDQRVLLNLAAFLADYSDLQVSSNYPTAAGGFVTEVRNAAAIRSKGVELEAKWVIDRHFRLAANVTYLDTRYTSYPNSAPSTLQTLEGKKVADDTGWATPYAPNWSGNLTGTYSVALPGDYVFSAEAEPIAVSNYKYGLFDTRQFGYVRVDGGLSLEHGRWGFDVIGKNLTNRDIINNALTQTTSPGTQLVARQEPRNVAAQIRFKW